MSYYGPAYPTNKLDFFFFFKVCVRLCGHLHLSLWLLFAIFFHGIIAATVVCLVYKLMPELNCIVMRDQEVIEQPMTVETIPQRMLAEAQDFIKR